MINAVNVYIEEMTRQGRTEPSPNCYSGYFGESRGNYRKISQISPVLRGSNQYLNARDGREMAYRALANLLGSRGVMLDVRVEDLEILGDFKLDRIPSEGVSKKGNRFRRSNMTPEQLAEFERILKTECKRADLMSFLEGDYLR